MNTKDNKDKPNWWKRIAIVLFTVAMALGGYKVVFKAGPFEISPPDNNGNNGPITIVVSPNDQVLVVTTTPENPVTQATTSTSNVTSQASISEKCPSDSKISNPPIGGKICEGNFPASITGPALIEWWNPDNNTAGVYVVSNNESFTWNNSGHYWIFMDESVPRSQYDSHYQNYAARYPDISVIQGPPQ